MTEERPSSRTKAPPCGPPSACLRKVNSSGIGEEPYQPSGMASPAEKSALTSRLGTGKGGSAVMFISTSARAHWAQNSSSPGRTDHWKKHMFSPSSREQNAAKCTARGACDIAGLLCGPPLPPHGMWCYPFFIIIPCIPCRRQRNLSSLLFLAMTCHEHDVSLVCGKAYGILYTSILFFEYECRKREKWTKLWQKSCKP